MSGSRRGLGGLGVLTLVAACTGALPAPVAADAVVAREAYAGVEVQDLAAGRELYVAKCSGCHTLPHPEAFPAAEWGHWIDSMRTEAEVELTDDEARRIGAYLYAMASREAGASEGSPPAATSTR